MHTAYRTGKPLYGAYLDICDSIAFLFANQVTIMLTTANNNALATNVIYLKKNFECNCNCPWKNKNTRSYKVGGNSKYFITFFAQWSFLVLGTRFFVVANT